MLPAPWSLTKGQKPPPPSALACPSQFPSNFSRMANGQDAPPTPEGGEPRESNICSLGQGRTGWVARDADPVKQTVCPREMLWAALARLGWRGQPALWTRRSCRGVHDGWAQPAACPPPAHTLLWSGQLLGGAQHMPGQAVGPGQLVPGRRGGRAQGAFRGSAALGFHPQGFSRQLWPSYCSQLCPSLAPTLDF